MKKIISEEILTNVINCIAHATHTNVSYIQVNQLLNELQKLQELTTNGTDTQC